MPLVFEYNTLINAVFIGVFCALWSYFFDYCIGQPRLGDRCNPQSVFFGYTMFLVGFLEPKKTDAEDNGQRVFRLLQAVPRMTWQLPFGICPVCSNVWIGFIVNFLSIFLTFSQKNNIFIDNNINSCIFVLLFSILISHLFLRKIL